MKYGWKDTEEIAVRLCEKFPGLDPLTVRFTDLKNWVLELPDFENDPVLLNEKVLEAVQMAWLEEFQAER